MIEDAVRHTGGAEVEDQNAFVVEVGVEELDRFGDVDAKFLEDGSHKDAAASARSAFANREHVTRAQSGRL